MKITIILSTLFVAGLAFASHPILPRTLSLLKVTAVTEAAGQDLDLRDTLVGMYELRSSNQYVVEKSDPTGRCSTILYDLEYAPRHIPRFFTINALRSTKRIYIPCILNR